MKGFWFGVFEALVITWGAMLLAVAFAWNEPRDASLLARAWRAIWQLTLAAVVVGAAYQAVQGAVARL